MERIVFDEVHKDEMNHFVFYLHLQAYVFAFRYIRNLRIIDAACGAGFGSMIFSTTAKSIVAVDKNQGALDKAQKLPHFCPIEFKKLDLEKDKLPKADVCVSIETIEHLKNKFFLENLQVDKLIYSVPTKMPKVGFHKQSFPTAKDAIRYLTSAGWITTFSMVGDNESMLGVAERL